jgi:hypothetical protein
MEPEVVYHDNHYPGQDEPQWKPDPHSFLNGTSL